jgi:hypothetical protein
MLLIWSFSVYISSFIPEFGLNNCSDPASLNFSIIRAFYLALLVDVLRLFGSSPNENDPEPPLMVLGHY